MEGDFDLHCYYRSVLAYDKNRNIFFSKKWILPFPMLVRWEWYFKYRAALLQVQYPKADIKILWGRKVESYENVEKRFKDKLRARKSKVTEMKNKLDRSLKKATGELFGIEDHPEVEKYKQRIIHAEKELEKYQSMTLDQFYQELEKHNYENQKYFFDDNGWRVDIDKQLVR